MANEVVTYIGYGSPQTKIYIPIEQIQMQIVDGDGNTVQIKPGKRTIDAFYGTETASSRNLVIPKGAYKVQILIKGQLHDLLASEYGGGSDLSGYTVKNNLVDFYVVRQQLATSNPLRILYPHWGGVGTHQEFEGYISRLNLNDDAGIGSGLDFPNWPFEMIWEVGDSIPPF